MYKSKVLNNIKAETSQISIDREWTNKIMAYLYNNENVWITTTCNDISTTWKQRLGKTKACPNKFIEYNTFLCSSVRGKANGYI